MMPDTLVTTKVNSESSTSSNDATMSTDQAQASGAIQPSGQLSPQYLEDTYDLLFQRYVKDLSEVIKDKPEGGNNNRAYCNNNHNLHHHHHHQNGYHLDGEQSLRKNKLLKMDTSGDPMEHSALLAQLQGVTLKESNPIITFSHVEDDAEGASGSSIQQPEEPAEDVPPEVEFAEVDGDGSGRNSPMLGVPKMDLSNECKRPPL